MGFSSPQDLYVMTLTVSNNAACAVCIGNFPQNWLQKISFNVEYLSGCGLAIVLHTTQHCQYSVSFLLKIISLVNMKKTAFFPQFPWVLHRLILQLSFQLTLPLNSFKQYLSRQTLIKCPNQGHNHRENLVAASAMVSRICPPCWAQG